MALTPAIFLDKDGTLLADVPYNVNPRRMRFAPGAASGLARLAMFQVPLIVISNQPGIALGKFMPDAMSPVLAELTAMFQRAGAVLGGFYYCPHHPDGIRPGYAKICECRKPAPGLLRIASQRQGIDLGSSWFIGDILDDVEAGHRAGCRSILLNNGGETEWRHNEWRTPEAVVPDLDEASQWLVDKNAFLRWAPLWRPPRLGIVPASMGGMHQQAGAQKEKATA